MKETIQKSCAILYQVVTSERIKLDYGQRQRSRIRKDMSIGVKPSGYRVAWMEQTVTKIFHLMGDSAAEFNRKYPFDRISVQDLSDVIATSWNRLKRHIQQKG